MAPTAGTPADSRTASRGRLDERVLQVVFLGFGIYFVAIGLLALISPGTFFEEIGPFGVRNDHYTRDAGTFQLAFGIAALIAARHASWRIPFAVTFALQFLMHTVNHLADIDEADPEWLGPADFAGLAFGLVILVGLVWFLRRQARRP